MKFEDALNEKKFELEKDDEILIGKYKNKKAIIKGFGKDDNNQPTVDTNKGERKVHNFRIKKLMPKKKDD